MKNIDRSKDFRICTVYTAELSSYCFDWSDKLTCDYVMISFFAHNFNVFAFQGGFAKCYELTDAVTKQVLAGKIVPKTLLVKPHQREKVLVD